jgi:hypothetical protein
VVVFSHKLVAGNLTSEVLYVFPEDKKRRGPEGPLNLGRWLHSFEAVSTIDGAVAFRIERYLARFATITADDVVHFSWGVHGRAALGPTVGTTRGFVSEPFFGIESLLVSGKSKIFAAFFANERLILIFQENSPPPWTNPSRHLASLENQGLKVTWVFYWWTEGDLNP